MPAPTTKLAVVATEPAFEARGRALAGELGLPMLATATDPVHCSEVSLLLMVVDGGLLLQQTGRAVPGPVAVDFGAPGMRHRRRGGQNELLGKATGAGKISHLAVLDATAGLGRDSFVLADLGCRVTACERNPVITALLRSGLDTASCSDDIWLRDNVGRIVLVGADARELPASVVAAQQVIYLDPMFPGRLKSAAVKKEMALFQALLDSDRRGDDSADLLRWALACNVARVVVKRPARAPCLAGLDPSHVIAGKSVRFDVYVRRALTG